MKLAISVVLVILLVFSVSSEKARFDNYRVYKVDIDTVDQLNVLRQLSEISDSYIFWEEPNRIKSSIELVVPPHQLAHFSDLMDKFEFNNELTNKNLQESIDKEQPKIQRKADGVMDWDDYQSTETINNWINAIQEEFPSFITVEEIGYSQEGRPIKLVKLSKKANNRVVFIEANIHAREWIASATSTWILNQLLRSTDADIQFMSSNTDWHIIPMANPDGYEYTRNSNRNWRKTRSQVSLVCWGVDPNRNFAYNWLVKDENGNEGASRAPCSDTYAGKSPFTEKETIAINDYVTQNRDKIDVYLSFHSYAHQILFPMGHNRTRIPNFDEVMSVGEAAAAKLFTVYGTQYEVGSTIELLYAASGVSVDHAYGEHKIPIGFTYEMRGNGDYGQFGFFLPPQFIIPNAMEVMQSLIGLVKKTKDLGYLGGN